MVLGPGTVQRNDDGYHAGGRHPDVQIVAAFDHAGAAAGAHRGRCGTSLGKVITLYENLRHWRRCR